MSQEQQLRALLMQKLRVVSKFYSNVSRTYIFSRYNISILVSIQSLFTLPSSGSSAPAFFLPILHHTAFDGAVQAAVWARGWAYGQSTRGRAADARVGQPRASRVGVCEAGQLWRSARGWAALQVTTRLPRASFTDQGRHGDMCWDGLQTKERIRRARQGGRELRSDGSTRWLHESGQTCRMRSTREVIDTMLALTQKHQFLPLSICAQTGS